jgi:hypothetical protein
MAIFYLQISRMDIYSGNERAFYKIVDIVEGIN